MDFNMKSYYNLSRNWFDFSFDNPEKVKPNHTALYFFCIEHCNRLGWKEKFGLPTTMAKEAIGVHSYNTYINTLNDLVDFGFIKMIQKSKNQYSSNIIALSNFDKALNKALDKAFIKHDIKQSESIIQSTVQSIDSINIHNIQIYKDTISKSDFLILKNVVLYLENKFQDNSTLIDSFNLFWDLYDKKVGNKEKLLKKWEKLTIKDRELIMNYIPKYKKAQPDKKFRKDPSTFLNNKSWNDEIIGGFELNSITTLEQLHEYNKENGIDFSIPTHPDLYPDVYKLMKELQIKKITNG